MGQEGTYRAQQHACHFPDPAQRIIRSYLIYIRHISILFSHLCLGLTSVLQRTEEISLLKESGLQLYDAIHDTNCHSLSTVYCNCTTDYSVHCQ